MALEARLTAAEHEDPGDDSSAGPFRLPSKDLRFGMDVQTGAP